MNQLVTNIYTKCRQLPPLKEGSYFHSRKLMEVLEAAPLSHADTATLPDDTL